MHSQKNPKQKWIPSSLCKEDADDGAPTKATGMTESQGPHGSCQVQSIPDQISLP